MDTKSTNIRSNEDLFKKMNEMVNQLFKYSINIYTTVKRRIMLTGGKEFKFTENGLIVSGGTNNNRIMDVIVSAENNPLKILFIFDIQDEINMKLSEFKISMKGQELLSGRDFKDIFNNMKKNKDTDGKSNYLIRELVEGNKEKEEWMPILNALNDDSCNNIEQIIKKMAKTYGIDTDDNEVKAFFDVLKNYIIADKLFSNKVDKAVKRFEERDTKDKIRRIELYEEMLKDIDNSICFGKEIGMNYEAIYADIIKKLRFKNDTMLFAFIEYAKRCVDQKDCILKTIEFEKNSNKLLQYRVPGLREVLNKNPIGAIKKAIEDIQNGR